MKKKEKEEEEKEKEKEEEEGIVAPGAAQWSLWTSHTVGRICAMDRH